MSNQSPFAPSPRTVGRSSSRVSKLGKYGNIESYGKVQEIAGERRVCRMPGRLVMDTMEGPLWRQSLGRSLGSHDVAERVGGMFHGDGYRQETTRLHALSCTKTAWSSFAHNRLLHQALVRSVRESKVQLVVEDT